MTQQNNSGKSNRVSVPEAKAALDNMKYEIANELGVNLKQGYNGDLSSRVFEHVKQVRGSEFDALEIAGWPAPVWRGQGKVGGAHSIRF